MDGGAKCLTCPRNDLRPKPAWQGELGGCQFVPKWSETGFGRRGHGAPQMAARVMGGRAVRRLVVVKRPAGAQRQSDPSTKAGRLSGCMGEFGAAARQGARGNKRGAEGGRSRAPAAAPMQNGFDLQEHRRLKHSIHAKQPENSQRTQRPHAVVEARAKGTAECLRERESPTRKSPTAKLRPTTPKISRGVRAALP